METQTQANCCSAQRSDCSHQIVETVASDKVRCRDCGEYIPLEEFLRQAGAKCRCGGEVSV